MLVNLYNTFLSLWIVSAHALHRLHKALINHTNMKNLILTTKFNENISPFETLWTSIRPHITKVACHISIPRPAGRPKASQEFLTKSSTTTGLVKLGGQSSGLTRGLVNYLVRIKHSSFLVPPRIALELIESLLSSIPFTASSKKHNSVGPLLIYHSYHVWI